MSMPRRADGVTGEVGEQTPGQGSGKVRSCSDGCASRGDHSCAHHRLSMGCLLSCCGDTAPFLPEQLCRDTIFTRGSNYYIDLLAAAHAAGVKAARTRSRGRRRGRRQELCFPLRCHHCSPRERSGTAPPRPGLILTSQWVEYQSVIEKGMLSQPRNACLLFFMSIYKALGDSKTVQSDSEVLFFSFYHSLKASSLTIIPTTTSLASKLHQRRWSSAESFGQCVSSPETSGERPSLVAAFTAHVSKDPFSPSAEVILAGSTTLSCIQLHFAAIYPHHRSKNIWSFHTEMPRKHK